MKLICLVGCSASGKDYIMKKSLSEIENLKPVVSHTSRPMRNCEVNGREYHFVTNEEVTQMLNNDEFIEKRLYNVATLETWVYGIHKDAIDLSSDNDYIAIVDIQGLRKLKSYFKDNDCEDSLTSVYLDVPIQTRLLRSLSREGNMSDIQVAEVLRRAEDDRLFVEAYKEECDYILNNDKEECVKEIIDFIKYYILEKESILTENKIIE